MDLSKRRVDDLSELADLADSDPPTNAGKNLLGLLMDSGFRPFVDEFGVNEAIGKLNGVHERKCSWEQMKEVIDDGVSRGLILKKRVIPGRWKSWIYVLTDKPYVRDTPASLLDKAAKMERAMHTLQIINPRNVYNTATRQVGEKGFNFLLDEVINSQNGLPLLFDFMKGRTRRDRVNNIGCFMSLVSTQLDFGSGASKMQPIIRAINSYILGISEIWTLRANLSPDDVTEFNALIPMVHVELEKKLKEASLMDCEGTPKCDLVVSFAAPINLRNK
jgi:hypothetical protein